MKYKYCPWCGSLLEAIKQEGKERLHCSTSSCNYVFWDNPVPVVAAIIEYQQQMILVRNKEWPEKMFGLVSGFLEKEESPEEAILREIQEELNLVGSEAEYIGHYPFYPMNQIILAFFVKAEGELKQGEELAEIKLVPREKLRPWPFGTGFAVKDWLAKQGISISLDAKSH